MTRQSDREAVAERVDEINAQIRALTDEMMRVLRTDPDYNAYVERCERRGLFPEVPLRTLWIHLDTAHRIEANEPSDPDEAVKYWRKHRKEYTRCSRAVLLR